MITSLKVPVLSWSLLQLLYVYFVMAGLLVQGVGPLVLGANSGLTLITPWILVTIMNGNPPHAWLHVVWGAFGLVYLSVYPSWIARIRLGFVFGTFYTLLGFLGVFVHHPFGMRLDLPENLFHFTVGPLMLLITSVAWRAGDRPALHRRVAR